MQDGGHGRRALPTFREDLKQLHGWVGTFTVDWLNAMGRRGWTKGHPKDGALERADYERPAWEGALASSWAVMRESPVTRKSY